MEKNIVTKFIRLNHAKGRNIGNLGIFKNKSKTVFYNYNLISNC